MTVTVERKRRKFTYLEWDRGSDGDPFPLGGRDLDGLVETLHQESRPETCVFLDVTSFNFFSIFLLFP